MSLQTLYGIYYKCPCERGLTCEGDKTIVGAITNTNFGVCHDIGTLDTPSSETAHPLAQNAAGH